MRALFRGTLPLLVLLAAPAAADEVAGFEPILLPIYLPDRVSGLGGAAFTTDAFVTVYSPDPFLFFPAGTDPAAPPGIALHPADTRVLLIGGRRSEGRFVLVEREKAGSVWLTHSIRSWDASGAVADIAALPTVRQTRFTSGPLQVFGAPFDWRYETDEVARTPIPVHRRALRIYSSEAGTGGRVAVRLFAWLSPFGSIDPIRTWEVELDRRDGDDPSYPAYAVVDLPDLCFPFSLHTPCLPGPPSSRVEVEPLTPGLRVWAFVTAVDNDTQRMSVFQPE